MNTILSDIKYSMRQLRRSPGFTGVILVSLALGIGANTAIFSLLDAVLWKMLPVTQPEQLVFLERYSSSDPPAWRKFCEISYPLLRELERSPLLDGATTFKQGEMIANVSGETVPLKVLKVAENFYPLLGVGASDGRMIQFGDIRRGNIVVLGYGYWQRQFGGKSVIGDYLNLDGSMYMIVGVAARDFFGLDPSETFDISVPLSEEELQMGMSPTDPNVGPLFWVLARLRPNVTHESAAQNLTAMLRQLYHDESPAGLVSEAGSRQRIELHPASQGLNALRAKFSQPLLLLMAFVALVLLITCVNVANMLLARATTRRREMAIRASLGAWCSRLVRQLVTENIVLALLGGTLGLIVANWCIAGVQTLASSGFQPVLFRADLNQRTLLFTLTISLFTGVLFGLAPAWNSANAALIYRQLKSTARTIPKSGRFLIAGQMALSVVLLMGTGLFVRSLQNLQDFDAGFRRENVLVVALDPQRAGLNGTALASFYVQLLERIEAFPDVSAATFERNIPLSSSGTQRPIAPPNYQPPGGENAIATPSEEVGPRYFTTIGMNLAQGRDFRVSDDWNAPKVVVINEAAALEFFPGQNPLGLRIGPPGNREELEIIGVVRDARHADLREPARTMIYLPALQDPRIRDTKLMIRTVNAPLNFTSQVRQIVRDVNPKVPVTSVTTLEETASRALLQDRLLATLASIFSFLVITLLAVGLGGMLLYVFARRTNEIGIRMALGATRGKVIMMVLSESLKLVGLGLFIGIPCSILTAHSVQKQLFGIAANDPAILAVVTALLTVTALLSACWPAWRASKVDPVKAIRYE